jgi:hypothetical protein
MAFECQIKCQSRFKHSLAARLSTVESGVATALRLRTVATLCRASPTPCASCQRTDIVILGRCYVQSKRRSEGRASMRHTPPGLPTRGSFRGENARTQACTNSIVGARQR